ncbi:hypothetical protein [Streptomyces sp. NBC_00525]|uniref:hypothetical protein n=1 Tax=Streptomyces sp. NBC_00525 TaxID=2903660 RepID=UPI002E807EE2|nr:hypothetical protein [Streptomyces sp. NBC_00525]WUC97998.1 hypothetical protein OG710_30460 [Streptomyces sp. NBC_00525]
MASNRDRDRDPALLEPQGPVATAVHYVLGTALFLGAGGFCVYATVRTVSEFGDTNSGWTWAGAVLALGAAFVAWIGLSTVVAARMEREATLRLAGAGVEASALVLAVASAPPTNDYHHQVRLTLRISGPGFVPFECATEVLRHRFGGAAQGTMLSARVDPVTRAFTIERPRPPADPATAGT